MNTVNLFNKPLTAHLQADWLNNSQRRDEQTWPDIVLAENCFVVAGGPRESVSEVLARVFLKMVTSGSVKPKKIDVTSLFQGGSLTDSNVLNNNPYDMGRIEIEQNMMSLVDKSIVVKALNGAVNKLSDAVGFKRDSFMEFPPVTSSFERVIGFFPERDFGLFGKPVKENSKRDKFKPNILVADNSWERFTLLMIFEAQENRKWKFFPFCSSRSNFVDSFEFGPVGSTKQIKGFVLSDVRDREDALLAATLASLGFLVVDISGKSVYGICAEFGVRGYGYNSASDQFCFLGGEIFMTDKEASLQGASFDLCDSWCLPRMRKDRLWGGARFGYIPVERRFAPSLNVFNGHEMTCNLPVIRFEQAKVPVDGSVDNERLEKILTDIIKVCDMGRGHSNVFDYYFSASSLSYALDISSLGKVVFPNDNCPEDNTCHDISRFLQEDNRWKS